MNWRGGTKIGLLLAIVALCLFEFMLHRQSSVVREFEAALLSLQWMLLACITVWCGTVIFLTFSLNDLPLIGLLLIVIAMYFICYPVSLWEPAAIILLTGVMLGKGARALINEECRMKNEECENTLAIVNCKSAIENFLVGLVLLLAFSSWWHLDMSGNFYHGPRWMGLWNSPNIYGMLMSAGVVLAIGLLAPSPKSKSQTPGSAESAEGNASGATPDTASGTRALPIFLFIAAGMMVVGLFFSYSRGAWLGTAVGLLYLAKAYGKLKWRLKSFLYSVFCFLLLLFGVWFFWNTPRTAPWYFQRLDMSRSSVQHRLAAWKAGMEIMRDHPFGVGWNKAVDVYQKSYSPPENGVAAITTNDYLMLGTQLGIPALICFVAYVGLCLYSRARYSVRAANNDEDGMQVTTRPILDLMKAACRAGALAMLVEFWFDGGLFDLPTASVFWILLELGTSDLAENRNR
jgi:O-antigen ligase